MLRHVAPALSKKVRKVLEGVVGVEKIAEFYQGSESLKFSLCCRWDW